MHDHYYLVSIDAPAAVEVNGPFRTAHERDAARTSHGEHGLSMDPTPHEKNVNDECLLVLVGLDEGVLDVDGPYCNEEEREIAMLRLVYDGQPFVIGLNVRRGVVAHTVTISHDDVDLDSAFVAPEAEDSDDPVREEDAFLDWLNDYDRAHDRIRAQ